MSMTLNYREGRITSVNAHGHEKITMTSVAVTFADADGMEVVIYMNRGLQTQLVALLAKELTNDA
jgi:hypothetical protein